MTTRTMGRPTVRSMTALVLADGVGITSKRIAGCLVGGTQAPVSPPLGSVSFQHQPCAREGTAHSATVLPSARVARLMTRQWPFLAGSYAGPVGPPKAERIVSTPITRPW